jgi:hypothetical protein
MNEMNDLKNSVTSVTPVIELTRGEENGN